MAKKKVVPGDTPHELVLTASQISMLILLLEEVKQNIIPGSASSQPEGLARRITLVVLNDLISALTEG